MGNERKWTQLWLKYDRRQKEYDADLGRVNVSGFGEDTVEKKVLESALKEWKRGFEGYTGKSVTEDTAAEEAGLRILKDASVPAEGYVIEVTDPSHVVVKASEAKGVLYGIFALLRAMGLEQELSEAAGSFSPSNPLRMLNHWDNMSGDIERGYSGNSFFFKDGEILVGDRTRDYARFISSVGINAIVINNVNVKQQATWLITDRYFDKVSELSRILEEYGVKLFLSLNYAACMEIGGLDSADPMDPKVIAWWKERMKEVFARIPNLGGFLVKADSEGRPGPFTYGRTQADGANMLADIVKEYDALIIWRCFVYNCQQDWRDLKTDRARAGYDNFKPMDGDYHENVILQIKNGPMDFQIREPVSPLLGGLTKTNQMLEVQIAQEYTGHQIDVCYLIPMFKEVLDFKTYCAPENDTVADVVSGRAFGNKNAGMAAVCNTGDDENWTGNDLAAANLYGFGRLAFDMELTSEAIAEEWAGLTFENKSEVKKTVVTILLPSRKVYEKYTSPLGIGWMVRPHDHYGCSVDGYEYDRWGTYHRADHLGIGVDRSHNGTGYALQYHQPNADMYDDPETCPEELLLFFHHVSYDKVLKSGKTLIQHIYDSHFEGYDEAVALRDQWKSLEGQIENRCYENVAERFERQLYNAREWKDQVNSYFFRKSGIPDEKNREIY
ncbi:MAG: alpha-glucuronidase [Lachnospiraceae bacterium]|nr:alpha-glucuronidase [Lachnospiraceae bacterium]